MAVGDKFKLLSDNNTKTINGESLLGNGDIIIETNPSVATLNKTFEINERVEMPLSKNINGIASVSVTKQVPQEGVTNNDSNIRPDNFICEDFALATTLTPNDVNATSLTLGEGVFTDAMVGMQIEGNGGKAILLDANGSCITRSLFVNTNDIASGDWTLKGLEFTNGELMVTGTHEVKIKASNAGAGDYYGTITAVGSNKIVVGSRYEDTTAYNAGSVYIYDLDGTNEIKIQSSDVEESDSFGYSVAVGDNKIVVGSRFEDTTASNAGAIYIYDLDGTNEIKVQASDAEENDYFGYSVSVGSGKIVVGCFAEDTTASNSGSIYIYDLDGTNEIKVQASDAEADDSFGYSVAVGDNKIVVGAYGEDTTASNAGAIYIYDLDGTNEIKVQASDAEENDNFGKVVAVGSNKIVVGSTYEDTTASNAGSVYIYDLDGTNEIKIQASDASADDYFGRSVAVGDSKIIVGADGEDTTASNAGAVYIYDLDGTNEIKIQSFDIETLDYFGTSVAVGDNKIVVGAYGEDEIGSSSGAVYVYDITPHDKTQYLPSITTSTIDTRYWIDINDIATNETQNGGSINYAISTDNRNTWLVNKAGAGERQIIRNNAGIWEYNSDTDYTLITWTAATTNNEFQALSEAMTILSNKMPKSQLEAITDEEQFTLGDTIDTAIIFNIPTDTIIASPSSDGIDINYDGAVKDVGAINGIDYTWSMEANDKVFVEALVDNTLKINVIG